MAVARGNAIRVCIRGPDNHITIAVGIDISRIADRDAALIIRNAVKSLEVVTRMQDESGRACFTFYT